MILLKKYKELFNKIINEEKKIILYLVLFLFFIINLDKINQIRYNLLGNK